LGRATQRLSKAVSASLQDTSADANDDEVDNVVGAENARIKANPLPKAQFKAFISSPNGAQQGQPAAAARSVAFKQYHVKFSSATIARHLSP
jgi:hypothetical protein